MPHILVVEDSRTQAEQVRLILEAEGFQVHIAGTAEAALQMLGTFRFDLVLSDIMMPGMSGYDLCKSIKLERQDATPIILLTTLNDPLDIIRGLESGADNFLTKPCDPKQLVGRIRDVLENGLIDPAVGESSGGIAISFMGERFVVNSERKQILTLLISTFEDMVRTNRELQSSRIALAAAKSRVEEHAHRQLELADKERKQLQEQLLQAHKMEAIGRLAGGVAHDFNNLLTVIIGYTQALCEENQPDSRERHYAQEVLEAAQRAAALTHQLLAFSRRQILQPRVLQLNVVVANIEKLIRRLIGEDIRLHIKLDPELGRVKADPGQIEQVLMNLVVNARDAMPSGGNLVIETTEVCFDGLDACSHEVEKPGSYVMLAVSDTGIGMDRDTRARIFDPFFTTKEPGKGTGMGLATVYGIVKQSGGNVSVYSEPRYGTTFKVYLPRVEDAMEVESRPAAPLVKGGSETILVVEDETAVRKLICEVLAHRGYQVLQADEPQSALELFGQHGETVALLVTDLVMPQMNGRQLSEQATAVNPELKVLFMSGYTDTKLLDQGILSAQMRFLQKPFTPEALARKVREVLDGVQSQRTGRQRQ
jgi:signal transduction histidine kinase